MDAYRDQYATIFGTGNDVVLLAISVDSAAELASWARDRDYPFRFLSDEDGRVGRLYGARSTRSNLDNRNLFVVGPDGRIAYRQIPFREVDPTAYTELGDAVTRARAARP